MMLSPSLVRQTHVRRRAVSQPARLHRGRIDRWLGHVDWRDDIDVGVVRSTEGSASLEGRDPINRLNLAMVQAGLFGRTSCSEIEQEIDREIDKAWNQAMDDPYPDLSATMDFVYAEATTDEDSFLWRGSCLPASNGSSPMTRTPLSSARVFESWYVSAIR